MRKQQIANSEQASVRPYRVVSEVSRSCCLLFANFMKILLLNQCFYPDVASTGQHLTDLAVGLAEGGHQVTVIASDRGYDNPANRFPRRETWKGVTIIRIPSLAFGKSSK